MRPIRLGHGVHARRPLGLSMHCAAGAEASCEAAAAGAGGAAVAPGAAAPQDVQQQQPAVGPAGEPPGAAAPEGAAPEPADPRLSAGAEVPVTLPALLAVPDAGLAVEEDDYDE